MSTHKRINIVCITAALLAVAVTLFCVLGVLSGSITVSRELGYEGRIFDTSRVHTIDIVMNDWDGFIETCQSEEYASCTLVIDGEKYGNVGIRGKGNTSLSNVASMNSERYSFKVEFDQYENGKTYHGLDKLCLNNIIQDNTYMKDYVAYRLMGGFGVDAPLCSYAYLTVNGEDWGLYLAVEAIEDSFLLRNYGAEAGELYKPDSMSFGGGRGNGKGFNMDDFDFDEDFDPENFNAEDFDFGNFSFGGGNMPEQGEAPEGFGGSGNMPEQGEAPEGFSGGGGTMPQQGEASKGFSGGGTMPEQGEAPEGFSGGGTMPQQGEASKSFGGRTMPGGFSFGSGTDLGGFGGNTPEMPGGMGGGMGSDDVKLKYSDDDPDSYPNIFDNAKTDITNKDKERLIESLKTLSSYENLESALDIDEVLRYFVVHNYLVNGDSYTGSMIHNYYLYEKDGRLSMIPWDYNLAYGTFQGGSASNSVNDAIDEVLSDRPMQAWIFSDESYTEQYYALYAEFLQSADVEALIDETYALIAPYVEKDPTAFCTYEEFETAVPVLKQFCSLRSESVLRQLDGDETPVDTGDLNLSDMGTMNTGGGMGGGGDRPDNMGGGGGGFGNFGGMNGGERPERPQSKDGAAAEREAAPPADGGSEAA